MGTCSCEVCQALGVVAGIIARHVVTAHGGIGQRDPKPEKVAIEDFDERLRGVVAVKRAHEAELPEEEKKPKPLSLEQLALYEEGLSQGIVDGMQKAVDLMLGKTGLRIEDPPVKRTKAAAPVPPKKMPTILEDVESKLSRCAQTLLDVLTHDARATSREELSILSGYAMRGSFDEALADLRELGLLEGLKATPAGAKRARPWNSPGPAENLDFWCRKLDTCPAKLLRVLAGRPAGVSREELGRLAGYALSGSFDSALADLRGRAFANTGAPIKTHPLFLSTQ